MERKLVAFNLIFMCTLIGSGYLCLEYDEHKMIIFYVITIPSALGVAICSFLMATININNE